MSKGIDIVIKSAFNSDGVIEANKGLAKLAQDVKAANDEMRRATMRAEMSVNSYAANADKAVRAMGGGYKTLGEQLAELGKANAAVGTSAKAAGDAATKSAVGLEMAMGLARGSTEQTAKAFAMLAEKIPIIGKIGVAGCGAFAAALGGVIALVKSLHELIVTAFNLDAAPKELRDASSAMVDLNNAAEKFKAAMDDAREASRAQLAATEKEADALTKVAKAQIELNRQRGLGKAKTDAEKAVVNQEADAASAEADDLNAQTKREAKRRALLEERERIERTAAESNNTLTAARKNFGLGLGAEEIALDARDEIEASKRKLAENDSALAALDEEERAEAIVIEARKEKEKNAAREVDAAREKAAAELAAKKEADAAKAVEAERKAREKMEADLHAQRVKDAEDELRAAQGAASAAQGAASNAQSEFDRAFAMYRSDDHGAAQIAEERDYAADYKQLHKDAARYGGKWRIDELAALMAAGDTQGQAAKLEEWRKSRSFTPEVESMVRASAADKTRTTAEDELRKIEQNTAGLAAKVDELLAMK